MRGKACSTASVGRNKTIPKKKRKALTATIKVLATLQNRRHVRLIVNQVSAANEGRTIHKQLQLVVDRFVAPQLRAEGDHVPLVLELIGEIPTDPAVREAVLKRNLLLTTMPGAPAAKAISAAAARFAA